MPIRQGYGKRPRVKHDAYAALFSSPEMRLTQGKAEVVIRVDQESEADKRDARKNHRPRSVLGEISSNAVCTAVLPVGKIAKVRDQQPHVKAPEAQATGARRTKQKTSGRTRPEEEYQELKCDIKLAKEDGDQFASKANRPTSSPEPTSTPDFWTDHCNTLLEVNGTSIEDFDTWSADIAEHLIVTKIAEASYGEVFRLSLKGGAGTSNDESVLKIIALTPPDSSLPSDKRHRKRRLKQAELMSKPQDVASEVTLLQRMSSIPGFTNFRDLRVLKGRPSPPFIKAFKTFNKAQKAAGKDASHFPNPAIKSSYPDDQLWAVIEMQDAGTDLERLLEQGHCTSVWHAWDIFWRATLALAKGEQTAQFEHRDLHLGNVCIDGGDGAIDTRRKLGFTDVNITLIDYTISRAALGSRVAYYDLKDDPHIFNGDASQEIQYEVYRQMRTAVGDGTWEQFHPRTNLVWLHYVLYMLLDLMQERQAAPTRKYRREYAQWKRSNELRQILWAVSELLDPTAVSDELSSATGLVTLAVSHGWLDTEDVVGQEDTLLEEELAALRL